jgi:nucleotide-binding universal stress UspA family protein
VGSGAEVAIMSGVVLAVLEQPDTAARLLDAAWRLAELTRAARVNVLAVRTPPLATIMPTEQILTREQEGRIRAEEGRRAEALRAIFDAWVGTAEERRIAAEWSDVEGRAGEVVGNWGRRADFLVLKRPGLRDPEPDRQALHAALFDTDRPVLIVPRKRSPGPFGRRVAIAWRDDVRTTKAVLAAMRWLGHAERIDVLVGRREGAPEPRLPDILDEHGIGAELHVLAITGQRVFGEVLLAKAHELGSDMLVMGAFARNPARSLILGGVTRHMLAHADLPVFMRH